jgi:ABC-type transporter Mla maintaining outer membrane lipid asymmetry permease subunit MlaE
MELGRQSFGVACLTTIFTGMVLALQTAYSLPGLGVKYYIGTVVSEIVVRGSGRSWWRSSSAAGSGPA